MTAPVTPSPTTPGVGLGEDCQCWRCVESREFARKRGGYWLSEEGRAELIETFPDSEDGNAVRPLLDALNAAETALIRSQSAAVVDELQQICAEAYQVVGSLLSDVGAFGTEQGDKILDNLSQQKLVHADVLPWTSLRAQPGGEEFVMVPRAVFDRALRLLDGITLYSPSELNRNAARETMAAMIAAKPEPSIAVERAWSDVIEAQGYPHCGYTDGTCDCVGTCNKDGGYLR